MFVFLTNNASFSDQYKDDYLFEKQQSQNHPPEFTYMYDEENKNLVVLKNGLWIDSIIVTNAIEAILDGPICMMFFVKEVKNENYFIAEYYKHNILNIFHGDSIKFYCNLLRKLRRLKLYIFDKEQENLFCEENIDCFINLPKDAYKPCRHLKLEIENPSTKKLDYIRIELPED
ncbi:MAG: hypothetical protein Q8L85_07605 [Alphaproteobacteria bacterium]|nr:hypothetical protein [Alphaproteobacteria bacterium]